jgi:hypothetical protein
LIMAGFLLKSDSRLSKDLLTSMNRLGPLYTIRGQLGEWEAVIYRFP